MATKWCTFMRPFPKGIIVPIGGSILVAKIAKEIVFLNLNLKFIRLKAAKQPINNVRNVLVNATTILLIKVLYTLIPIAVSELKNNIL